MLALGLWRAICHTRIIRRKNRAMVQSIDQQIDYKKKLEKSRKELRLLQERLDLPLQTNATNNPGEEANDIEQEAHNSTSPQEQQVNSRKAFEQMEAVLIEEQPYLNRNFSHDDLMKLAGVGKNRIGQIVQQYAGTSVNAYINNLRLEYAVKLMKENGQHTIENIAQESGIPNMSTFYRLFRERFSITPTEYKKGLEEIEANSH